MEGIRAGHRIYRRKGKSRQLRIEVSPLPNIKVRDMDEESPRDIGLIDHDLLAQKKVCLVGAGMVGSHFAVRTTEWGVRSWVIVDPDVVEESNTLYGRTAYKKEHIGRPKVYAIASILEQISEDVRVEAEQKDILKMREREWEAMLAGTDVAVLAFDQPNALLRFAHFAYKQKVPCVVPALHRRGASGHVIYTISGITPCLRCTWRITQPLQVEQLNQERLLSINIAPVIDVAARTTISILTRIDQAWSEATTYIKPLHSNFLFVNIAGQERVFEISSFSRPNCSICGSNLPIYNKMRLLLQGGDDG